RPRGDAEGEGGEHPRPRRPGGPLLHPRPGDPPPHGPGAPTPLGRGRPPARLSRHRATDSVAGAEVRLRTADHRQRRPPASHGLGMFPIPPPTFLPRLVGRDKKTRTCPTLGPIVR